jgi:Tol biopolymer transport system component
MIAFSKGHLATATLFVVDAGDGSRRTLPGAQPGWFPDGKRLVYARPGADGAGGAVTRSDLLVFDIESGATFPLTATPDVIEMQPAVSPDGKTVVFSDWKSGRIMAIPSAKEVAP